MLSNSLRHRMDVRTKDIFVDNISDFHQRERLYAIAYRIELEERGKVVVLFNYGVDNSGKLIEGKLKNHNPDYLYKIDGKYAKFDIKTIPYRSGKYTFKTKLLESYVEHNAYMLVPKWDEYYVFSPAACQWLLDNVTSDYYADFSSNDPAKRILQQRVDQLVAEGLVICRQWMPKSFAFIEKHKSILFDIKRDA